MENRNSYIWFVTVSYHKRMKNKIVLWGIFLFLTGCNTSTRDKGSSAETIGDKNESGVIWKYSFNQEKETFEIIKMRPVDNDTLTGEALEKINNKAWPEVQIKYAGTSNDTAFIIIADSEVLTQQMGSAGSESFMISTTWAFSELKGVRYVAFDFEYGDHAMPGVYNRNSWEHIRSH
jgi:hypothetical protein